MITVPKLTLEDVKRIMEAAETKAKAIGVDTDIAIQDREVAEAAIQSFLQSLPPKDSIPL